jgi:hypothetical protein
MLHRKWLGKFPELRDEDRTVAYSRPYLHVRLEARDQH